MHISRKLFHATGIIIVLVYRLVPLDRTTAAALLWGIVGFLAVVDVLRWRYPAVQALFLKSMAVILDKKDHRGLNGSTLYFSGCALAITLFDSDPACAGILALVLGDPAAAIIGSSIKSPKKGNVSVAGSSACLVFATAGVAIFFPLPQALAAGAVATLLEAVSGAKADNLTMPVGVAALLTVL